MSREKQIEGMAKVIAKADHTCLMVTIAKALYNAGYRKQSEGEWIDLRKGKYDNPLYACSICDKGTFLKPEVDVLGNLKTVQALSPYCPNCGAKMKGGEQDA